MKTSDIKIGDLFGTLTVIELGRKAPHGRWPVAAALCRCVCGAERVIGLPNLRHGKSKNCGCQRKHRVTHGQSRRSGKTPEYRAWKAMKTRCYSKTFKQYKDYGGRGIVVCDRWLSSFANFFEDMGKRPNSEHSLDRIDNNGPYAPENCRWATPAEQRRNSRRTTWLTYRGKTLCLKDWAEELHMKPLTLYMRIKRGWPIERALSTPSRN